MHLFSTEERRAAAIGDRLYEALYDTTYFGDKAAVLKVALDRARFDLPVTQKIIFTALEVLRAHYCGSGGGE